MKKQSFQMKQWAKVCLALSLGLPLTACVDDSYDASKDIDMTMGLGSQGLQLKLGNTENIMLADLLEEDENLKRTHNTLITSSKADAQTLISVSTE